MPLTECWKFTFSLHLPARWDNWSETWFKTFCIYSARNPPPKKETFFGLICTFNFTTAIDSQLAMQEHKMVSTSTSNHLQTLLLQKSRKNNQSPSLNFMAKLTRCASHIQ